MKKLYVLTLCLFIGQFMMAQDDCASAVAIDVDIEYTVDEVNGPSTPDPICASGGSDNTDASEWYTYTAESTILLRITTDLSQNEGIDTRFHAYSGDCENLVCIGGDDDSGSGYLSEGNVFLNSGETVIIAFDNRWSSMGFDFLIEEQELGDFPYFIPSGPSLNGVSECVVDMNGDHLDDIVGVDGDQIFIQYQQEDGTFIEETKTVANGVEFSPSWSIAAGDIDGNGYNDLVYGNGTGVSFIYASDDGSSYSEIHTDEYVFCQRTNFVDLNSDGHLDAFVCHDVEPNVYYMNDGEGNLTFYQGGIGDTPNGGNYGSVWLDFDNDGNTDMFIAKCRGGSNPANINQMHRGDGNGNYVEVAGNIGLNDSLQTWSSAWADYDNDGDMDGYIGASSTENGSHKLMMNLGGIFEDYTANTLLADYTDTGIENAPYDFDNDGYVDIITNNGEIIKNNGDLTFTAQNVAFGRAAIGDLNNDGFLDCVANGSIYFNLGNENNYIKINTVGTLSNLNGIGARVTIETPMGSQIRDVRSGESFSVMSSLVTHFGIGTDEEIYSITVSWPSGMEDVVLNPEINSTITVVEGTSVGINELSAEQLNVYPNPCTDFISIESVDINSGTLLEVYDQAGRLVLNAPMLQNRLDVTTLASGKYNVLFTNQDKRYRVNFVKE